jgi:alpha-tubulin suppressor-like RCC1 family protein
MSHSLFPLFISCTIVTVVIIIINFTYLNKLDLPGAFTESTISYGLTHTCAISGGEVYCWGRRLEIGPDELRPVLIGNMSNALYIASAYETVCIVTTLKTVYCIGSVIQINAIASTPILINGITTAVGIWARRHLICVKLESGQAQCFGIHQTLSVLTDVEDGTADTSFVVPHTLVGITDVDTIKPGHHNLICVTKKHKKELHCAGDNENGELGNGGYTEVLSLSLTPILTNVHHFEISHGFEFMCAVYSSEYRVACWGTDIRGAMGGTGSPYLTPRDVPGITHAQTVAIAIDTTCVLLKSHEVVCFGDHTYGQFGSGALYGSDDGDTPVPQYVYSLTDVVELVAGQNHFCAKTKHNRFYCWGRNNYGQLGSGIAERSHTPLLSQSGSGTLVVGFSTTCLFSPTGVKCYGYVENTAFTYLSSYRTVYRDALTYSRDSSNVIKMTNAGENMCFLLSDGRIYCEGANYAAQLGSGNTTHPLVGMVFVQGITNAVDICSTNYYSCAVLSTGRAMCWGTFNTIGIDEDLPTLIQGAINTVNVTCGAEFVCFKFQNNSLGCAGDNTFGEVGDGTDTFAPNLVIVRTDILSSAPNAFYHNCLIDSNKLVRCSGDNEYGQMGAGGSQFGFTETIDGITNALKVVVGGGFTCVLLESGIVKCLGANSYGQLGSGDYIDSADLVQVDLTGVVDLSAGEYHVCFKTNDGKNYCQGRNDKLQLGNGGLYEIPTELFFL